MEKFVFNLYKWSRYLPRVIPLPQMMGRDHNEALTKWTDLSVKWLSQSEY